ncbi:hypothetical protein TorRG33x02_273470, partial [Trema orientale]
PKESFFVEEEDWRRIYIDYIIHGQLSDDTSSAILIKRKADRFFAQNNLLFRKSFQGKVQRCLGPNEIEIVVKEFHAEDYGGHIGGRRLFEQLIIIGYYWPTMENDAIEFVRKCDACQKHGNLIHISTVELGSITSLWPFHTWQLISFGQSVLPQKERSGF